MKRLIAVVLMVVALGGSAVAHSGGLDSYGGHWNHSTGTYHYHR